MSSEISSGYANIKSFMEILLHHQLKMGDILDFSIEASYKY